MSLKMAERTYGQLSLAQRLVLRDFAQHMGVSDRHMVNWMNKLDTRKEVTIWADLDTTADRVEDYLKSLTLGG
jgi:hypothetical protein